MEPIPFYILGDGWQNPSGLGRIARDLTAILQVQQIGFHPPALVHDGQPGWHSFSHLGEDYGAETVINFLNEQEDGNRPGVLFVVWDPSRAYHYLPLRKIMPAWQLWGYFAIDGHNVNGLIGGPAAVAIQLFDRVLAYTEYGQRILDALRADDVAWLPHGHSIEPADVPPIELIQHTLIPTFRGGDVLVGCVATNQSRKDHRLFMDVIRQLRDGGHRAFGWLHTDTLVRAWSIPELAKQYKVENFVRVTTGTLSDEQLQQYYRRCSVVLGIGRGEGFGYTSVEAMACGTPALEMDYAGAPEHLPAAWRYRWAGTDYTNVYGIARPIGVVQDVVLAIEELLKQDRAELKVYCEGFASALHWNSLRERWQAWYQTGIDSF